MLLFLFTGLIKYSLFEIMSILNKHIDAYKENPEELIPFLRHLVTPERYQLIEKVLENRTQYITVVLEDIFQSQNASAVLRSCDCFGIQDVHIIENKHEYQINPDVALGSNKWLNLIKHNEKVQNTLDTIKSLRASGYRIVATTPHINDVNLDEFDIAKGKFALFFGSELKGLSPQAIDHADEYVKIPMHGFTESFNISVSVAIILHSLVNRLHKSNLDWHLDPKTKECITLQWLKKSIRRPNLIIKEYYRKNINRMPESK